MGTGCVITHTPSAIAMVTCRNSPNAKQVLILQKYYRDHSICKIRCFRASTQLRQVFLGTSQSHLSSILRLSTPRTILNQPPSQYVPPVCRPERYLSPLHPMCHPSMYMCPLHVCRPERYLSPIPPYVSPQYVPPACVQTGEIFEPPPP